MSSSPQVRSSSHIYPPQPPASQDVQKKPQTNVQSETNPEHSSQAQPDTSDNAELSEQSTASSRHQSEANSVHFADKPQGSSDTNAPEEMTFQDIEDDRGTQKDSFAEMSQRFKEKNYNVNDPAVQHLLNYIREIQDENIKSLLKGLDESLERARKMTEENMQHFYSKVEPQLKAAKAEVQQMMATTESSQEADLSKAKNRFATMMSDIQNQLSKAQGNPEMVNQVKMNLDFVSILGTL